MLRHFHFLKLLKKNRQNYVIKGIIPENCLFGFINPVNPLVPARDFLNFGELGGRTSFEDLEPGRQLLDGWFQNRVDEHVQNLLLHRVVQTVHPVKRGQFGLVEVLRVFLGFGEFLVEHSEGVHDSDEVQVHEEQGNVNGQVHNDGQTVQNLGLDF